MRLRSKTCGACGAGGFQLICGAVYPPCPLHNDRLRATVSSHPRGNIPQVMVPSPAIYYAKDPWHETRHADTRAYEAQSYPDTAYWGTCSALLRDRLCLPVGSFVIASRHRETLVRQPLACGPPPALPPRRPGIGQSRIATSLGPHWCHLLRAAVQGFGFVGRAAARQWLPRQPDQKPHHDPELHWMRVGSESCRPPCPRDAVVRSCRHLQHSQTTQIVPHIAGWPPAGRLWVPGAGI